MQKFALLKNLHVQADSGKFAFLFCGPLGRHQGRTYLFLDCTQKVEYMRLIAIHVNLDHAWVEHYPVTASTLG